MISLLLFGKKKASVQVLAPGFTLTKVKVSGRGRREALH